MKISEQKIQVLEKLLTQQPENHNLYLLMALEYAQQHEFAKAKYNLVKASLYCGKEYDRTMIAFMNYLYSSNEERFFESSNCDIFFKSNGFELAPSYSNEELDYIEKISDELQNYTEDDLELASKRISELPLGELIIVPDNDFYSF